MSRSGNQSVSPSHLFGSTNIIALQPSLPMELWIEITYYIRVSAGSLASLSRVNKALRACCTPRLFTMIYMRPTKSKKTVKLLSESPPILDTVQIIYYRPAPRTWLRRPNNLPPPYDEFVDAMWRMSRLTELYVQGIGNIPASLVDFVMNNTTLKRLGLFNVIIPPLDFHLQTPRCRYWSIEAASVTGSIERLFSNSGNTLQRLEIGSQFPMEVVSFLSHSSTSRLSRLVILTIRKSLTQEELSWVCRLLPCCPVLETLSIYSNIPSPMSTIPPEALPRLRSLTADVNGHALVLLDSPVRRVSSLTLTLKSPLMFHSLQGFQSQPTFISGEIAYACLITPNDDFHRLVINCGRFYSVVVPFGNPITEVCSRSP